MSKKIISVVFCLFCAVSSFGSEQSGFVDSLLVRASDGLIYFSMTNSSARTGVRPACATRDYWILIDENSESGKKQYALLLGAKLATRRIIVQGAEDCTRWVDGEDANSISLAL